MATEKQRQPTILKLKDDVLKDRPDLAWMQWELQGYMEELLKLGVDVNTNLLPSFVAIRDQESGNKWLISPLKILEAVGSHDVVQSILWWRSPDTLGSFQLNIHQVKNILCTDKTVLAQINQLLVKYPVEGITTISDPGTLSYTQLKILVKNNLYGLYFLNYTLTRTSRNLQSKAREWWWVYKAEDIAYTTHFAQNHIPQAMYSAIVLQNILQVARSWPNPIDLREAVDENYQDLLDWWQWPRNMVKKWAKAFNKEKILLNGVYNEEFRRLVALLKAKKWIDLKIEVSKDGFITKINGTPIIDNETQIDADKWFDVLALKRVFEPCHYTFYPLLSTDFAQANKNRVHDEYNYGFREYVANMTPEQRANRFAGAAPETALSTQVAWYKNRISYPHSPTEHGITWDGINKKAVEGHLDCVSRIKYLFMDADQIPDTYSYLWESEIDAYSYLWGANEYHHTFAEKLNPATIRMMTPGIYQNDHYFQIIASLQEWDVVGFGQEYPESRGGRKLTVQQPSKTKNTADIEASMSHGAVITRKTASNIWITMSSGEVGKWGPGVIEVPLFGPWGYYETMCLSQLQTPGLRTYKPLVFFGTVDKQRCAASMQERIQALGQRKIDIVNGTPVVDLDTYTVYHKAAGIDPVSKQRSNYCSQIARTNQQRLLAGMLAKSKIKYTDAKQHMQEIASSPRLGDIDFVYKQDWGDGNLEDITYRGFEGPEGNIICEQVYKQVLESLDAQKQWHTGVVPLLWDMYIDTAKWHRITIVYGKRGSETGYFVLDTLRGPAKFSLGKNGICSLSEYFASPLFYMNNESPYSRAYLRLKPIGVDMPTWDIVPFSVPNDYTSTSESITIEPDLDDIVLDEDSALVQETN